MAEIAKTIATTESVATTATIAPVALETRLKPFSLDATKLTFNDLSVAANQTVVLDSANEVYSKQLVKLAPQNIAELKSWIGVSDAAFAQTPVMAVRSLSVLPVETKYSVAQTATLRSLANDYIFGHSASVSPAQLPAVNAWLKSIAGYIYIILFRNITVASGARLVVNASVSTLFANDITIDKGGVIQMKSTMAHINCASIKGS
jgi:hypothetical protein